MYEINTKIKKCNLIDKLSLFVSKYDIKGNINIKEEINNFYKHIPLFPIKIGSFIV